MSNSVFKYSFHVETSKPPLLASVGVLFSVGVGRKPDGRLPIVLSGLPISSEDWIHVRRFWACVGRWFGYKPTAG
jgi:hypothetical protein